MAGWNALLPSLWATREEAFTSIMTSEMAQHLYDYGFKSKDARLQIDAKEELRDREAISEPVVAGLLRTAGQGLRGPQTSRGRNWPMTFSYRAR